MMFLLLATLLMSPFVLQKATSLKILIVQPHYMLFRSHLGFSLNLAKFLDEEGHQIHFLIPITNESYKLANKNDEIRLNVRYFTYKRLPSLDSLILNGDAFIDRIYIEIIEDLSLMDELRAEKFDMGIAEAYSMTEYSLALFHFLQIEHTIATHSQPISPFQLYLLGILSKMKQTDEMPTDYIGITTMGFLPSDDPYELLNMHSKELMEKDLKRRRGEIWTHCVNQTLAKIKEHINLDTEYQKLAEEKYHSNFPGWDRIFTKSRFFFINSSPELDFLQSKIVEGVEKIKFIGGINFGHPSEINEKAVENTNSLISQNLGTKEGVILVSFGTITDISIPEHAQILEALAGAMENFPNFLFIWKLSGNIKDKLRFKWNNVIIQSWINQKELLAHPKMIAFVSHCGMNSVLESLFNQMPIICVPFIGDQFYNAELLAFQNIGLMIGRSGDKQTMQNELISALANITGGRQQKNANSASMRFNLSKMKEVSAEFRQKNVRKIISDAMKEIEKEIGQEKGRK